MVEVNTATNLKPFKFLMSALGFRKCNHHEDAHDVTVPLESWPFLSMCVHVFPSSIDLNAEEIVFSHHNSENSDANLCFSCLCVFTCTRDFGWVDLR